MDRHQQKLVSEAISLVVRNIEHETLPNGKVGHVVNKTGLKSDLAKWKSDFHGMSPFLNGLLGVLEEVSD